MPTQRIVTARVRIGTEWHTKNYVVFAESDSDAAKQVRNSVMSDQQIGEIDIQTIKVKP